MHQIVQAQVLGTLDLLNFYKGVRIGGKPRNEPNPADIKVTPNFSLPTHTTLPYQQLTPSKCINTITTTGAALTFSMASNSIMQTKLAVPEKMASKEILVDFCGQTHQENKIRL